MHSRIISKKGLHMNLGNRILGRSKTGRTTYMIIGSTRMEDGSFHVWYPAPHKCVIKVKPGEGLHSYLENYERLAAAQEENAEQGEITEG
jgi:hypothetical protein